MHVNYSPKDVDRIRVGVYRRISIVVFIVYSKATGNNDALVMRCVSRFFFL